jgi:hypothetical protein
MVRRFGWVIGLLRWRYEEAVRAPFSFLVCLSEEEIVGFVLWQRTLPPETGAHASVFRGSALVGSRWQPLVTLACPRQVGAPFGFAGQRYLLPLGLLPLGLHFDVLASVLVCPLSSLLVHLRLRVLAVVIAQGCRRIGDSVSFDELLAFW